MSTVRGRLTCALTVITLLSAACNGGGGGDFRRNTAPQQPQTSPVLLETDEDTALSAQLSAVDTDGDQLTFTKTAEPTHGTLAITASGAITYSPSADYSGPDAFAAQASDGRGGTASATFSVNVRPVNDAPRFISTSVTFVEDTSGGFAQLEVSDPEGDAIDMTAVSNVSHGRQDTSGSSIFYSPDANFSGTDTFVARLTDDHGAASADTQISIVVSPVNDAPVAADDQFLYASGAAPLEVLANDSDIARRCVTRFDYRASERRNGIARQQSRRL